MNAQQVSALTSSTEARYRSRTPERDKKWKAFREGNLSSLRDAEAYRPQGGTTGCISRAGRRIDRAERGHHQPSGARLRAGSRPEGLHGARLSRARGTRAARSVCRIVIRSGNAIVGFGTGFLIAPRVLITNNHVLGSAADAAGSLAEFNFQRRLDGSPERVTSFALRPQDLFLTDTALDFSMVGPWRKRPTGCAVAVRLSAASQG